MTWKTTTLYLIKLVNANLRGAGLCSTIRSRRCMISLNWRGSGFYNCNIVSYTAQSGFKSIKLAFEIHSCWWNCWRMKMILVLIKVKIRITIVLGSLSTWTNAVLLIRWIRVSLLLIVSILVRYHLIVWSFHLRDLHFFECIVLITFSKILLRKNQRRCSLILPLWGTDVVISMNVAVLSEIRG